MSTKDYFSQITYLMIETNSSCNLKCSFCNREELVAKGWRAPLNLNIEQFRKILSPFKDCPIDTIKLEGISEPMMHPKFHDLALELRQTFPDAFVIIATNLQYNLKKTSFLDTLAHVDMVYLSIDGEGEDYEKARPGATWKRLVQSLEDIKSLVPVEVRRSKLHINFVCTEFNFHCLPKMYELKEAYDLASVRINLAQNWSEDQQNSRDFHSEMRIFLKQYASDVKGVAEWRYRDCFWPHSGIIIDVEGNIRQCIINTSQNPIGNIHKDNVRDIYNNSEHYLRVRESLAIEEPIEACKNCDYSLLTHALKDIFEEQQSTQPPRSFIRL
tara:strand:- start:10229 stop:11212 length:984 start_codon:yes stop_codon:yes gene_type:complete